MVQQAVWYCDLQVHSTFKAGLPSMATFKTARKEGEIQTDKGNYSVKYMFL